MAITVISWRPTKFTCVCVVDPLCVCDKRSLNENLLTSTKWALGSLRAYWVSSHTPTHTFTTYATIVAVHNSLSKFSLWHAPTPSILIKFSPYTQKRRSRRSWDWRRYKPTACIENKILQLLNTFQDMHGTCWLHVRIQCAKHDPTSKSLPRLQLQPHLQLLQLQSHRRRDESHRASLGPDSNVSFMSMPRSPFPHSHSHSHCDSLLPFAFHIPLPLPFPALGFRFRCLAV